MTDKVHRTPRPSLQTILRALSDEGFPSGEPVHALTKAHQVDAWSMIRAAAIARVRCFEALAPSDFAAPLSELAEVVGLYLAALAEQLERAGIPGAVPLLEKHDLGRAWPNTQEEIIARARVEIPQRAVQ